MVANSTLTSLLADSSRPTLSFEFFPPKDEASRLSLSASVDELAKLNPDFVSVTYGAMGSNQESSLEVVESLAKRFPTIAHLTCIGATRENIQALLDRYTQLGVAGILALRGDKPANFDSLPASDFRVALDLVNQVIQTSTLPVGVATFPEKHPESPSLEHDIHVLKLKQDAGATFAMTQLFFSMNAYDELVSAARSAGISIPIVPGVMPISNVKQVMRMAEMSGASVPDSLTNALTEASTDEDAQKVGMDFTVTLATELLAKGSPGLHIFTLNHHRAAIEVATGAGLG
jgi:methylenetetrahydrofolate reductase (NADPH)